MVVSATSIKFNVIVLFPCLFPEASSLCLLAHRPSTWLATNGLAELFSLRQSERKCIDRALD